MTRYRQVIQIYCLMLGEWLTQPRVYISFALGFVFMLVPSMNLYRYANWTGAPIQLAEAFIVTLSNQHNLAFMILGLFLLLADAPFLSGRITNVLVRVPRKTWLLAQLFYVFAASLTYMLVVCMFSLLLSIGCSYVDNIWSAPVYSLATNPPSIAITTYSVSFKCFDLIEQFSPWQALALNIVTVALYGTVIGLLLFIFALSRYRLAGWVIAMGMHLVGFLVLKDAPYHANAQLSLLVRAMPAYLCRGAPFPNLLNAFIVLISLILIFSAIALWRVPKADLCGMLGEER